MSRHRTKLGLLLLAVAGLGLGFASSRFAPTPESAASSADAEPTGAWLPVAVAAEADEAPRGAATGRRALLVGVTKYDHLAVGSHLSGPGNDVKLLRKTLLDRYRFRTEDIVCLTEDEGKPELRPTRANIAREFKRLADEAKPGDQVVVLLAGHGDRQPETDPPDAAAPEPDGIDEIFLPADVEPWHGFPARVPQAIPDKTLRDWFAAITAKKAYVWALFDCCHSGSMTRAGEVVRQLPAGVMVPDEELVKARERAAKRPGRPEAEPGKPSVVLGRNDFLVAMFACREFETTPESPQPASSVTAKYHGLLTYTVVGVLEQAAASATPLTYAELMQRVQAAYLARPQGAPTPTVEGTGRSRIVLGTETPTRPKIVLTKIKEEFVVNVGDLHGITVGSILRVVPPAATGDKPRGSGFVRVERTRPLDATVVAVEHDGTPKPTELPATGLCEIVAVDYSVSRLRLGVEPGTADPSELKRAVAVALLGLPKEDAGLYEVVEELPRAQFVIRLAAGGTELQVAGGKRPPIPLPAPDSESFADALTKKLQAIHRARSLIDVGCRLEGERSRSATGPDVTIEVLGHRSKDDPGTPIERPPAGWVFRPGDRVSFRITNRSTTKRLEVSLLVVDPDYRIELFHPGKNEINKALEPGASLQTAAGTITDRPPFGPENLVAIITAPSNPPVDYGLLTQPGVRSRGHTFKSPVGQLLERGLNGSGTRSGLRVAELDDQAARVLTWRTEPTPKK